MPDTVRLKSSYLYGITDTEYPREIIKRTSKYTIAGIIPKREKKTNRTKPFIGFRFKLNNHLKGQRKVVFVQQSTPKTLFEICKDHVDKIPLPKVLQWTCINVAKWICNIGFPQYRDTFFENNINGKSLIFIDSSALVSMNIKQYSHIKTITNEINNLYGAELVLYIRNTSVIPTSLALFCEVNKLNPNSKFIRSNVIESNEIKKNEELHWDRLEKWLQHKQTDSITLRTTASTKNLYKVKKIPSKDNVEMKPKNEIEVCNICTMPPCACKWSDKHLNYQTPSVLNYLNKYDSSFINVGYYNNMDNICNCVFICCCSWKEKEFSVPKMTTIVKNKLIGKSNRKSRVVIEDLKISKYNKFQSMLHKHKLLP